jgi:hypothetical protein
MEGLSGLSFVYVEHMFWPFHCRVIWLVQFLGKPLMLTAVRIFSAPCLIKFPGKVSSNFLPRQKKIWMHNSACWGEEEKCDVGIFIQYTTSYLNFHLAQRYRDTDLWHMVFGPKTLFILLNFPEAKYPFLGAKSTVTPLAQWGARWWCSASPTDI